MPIGNLRSAISIGIIIPQNMARGKRSARFARMDNGELKMENGVVKAVIARARQFAVAEAIQTRESPHLGLLRPL
jgi:hypothetical protein